MATAEAAGGDCLTRHVEDLTSVVRFRCGSGHIWSALAKWALRGRWCPTCARYDYSIRDMQAMARRNGGECLSTAYRGTLGKLTWSCAKGHVFTATPNTILGGSWCRRCRLGIPSIEEMRAIAEKRGGQCLSKRYVDNSTHLRWRCRAGHEWRAVPKHVKRGSWCPACAGKILTIGDLRADARRRGGACLSNRYVNSTTPLRFRCARGHVFESPPTYVRGGNWCPDCNPCKRGSVGRMRQVAASRGGRCISRTYVNARTKLTWECSKGHRWDTTPSHVVHGSWCPSCAGSAQETIADMQRMAEELGGRCLSRTYVKSRVRLRWQCRRRHRFEATPMAVMGGRWCLVCKRQK